MDIVDFATRSRMMSGIRSINTIPEKRIRSLLHRRGFRFRIHDKTLPGKPDIVLQKYHAVIFVNGCFWHGHNCSLFKLPATRREFWRNKIDKNRLNDKRSAIALQLAGWRIATVWECSMKGTLCLDDIYLADELSSWLHGDDKNLEISEKKAGGK